MKATVVEIQSKSYRGPGTYRRIGIQFDFGLAGTEIIRIPEHYLNIVGIALDDVVDVNFSVNREEPLKESHFKAKSH